MRFIAKSLGMAVVFAICLATAGAADDAPGRIESAVGARIRPVMAKYGIAGMAVGITVAGKSSVYNYGVASTETRQPVTRETLFEIGSITKTFTATLASYAQVCGYLSLSDRTGKYLPALQDSEFGKVTLLNLGTHTPGGLPLQVPDKIGNNDQLLQYFKDWRPTYEPGTYRTYSNLTIGTLGLITVKSIGEDFVELVEQRLFPALGMKSSYINIPKGKIADYAQGYTKENTPIRMTTGVLSFETYGIRATAADMIRFVEANMNEIEVDEKLRRAIRATHTGYFKVGPMTQDLIWEQYPYPVTLKTLLDGNAPEIIFNATPVTQLTPPEQPRDDVWINKTGSTNGFGAYVAFIPEKRLGIVILANKNYPIADRVTTAYQILISLEGGSGQLR